MLKVLINVRRKYLIFLANESLKLKLLKDGYIQKDNYDKDLPIFSDLQKYIHFNPSQRKRFESVLSNFLNYQDDQYNSDLIYFLGPFISSIEQDYECYFCFKNFMSLKRNKYEIGPLSWGLGKFMMLFRETQNQLYVHFYEEELEPNDWALSWYVKFYLISRVKTLLSRQLSMKSICRLWEIYFSINDFDLHLFVCLAILQHHKVTLIELNLSELITFLNYLGDLDVDKMVKSAYNIREFVREKEIL